MLEFIKQNDLLAFVLKLNFYSAVRKEFHKNEERSLYDDTDNPKGSLPALKKQIEESQIFFKISPRSCAEYA